MRKEREGKKLTSKQREMAVELYNGKKHLVQEICKIMGITKPTLYNYLREKNNGKK